MKLLWICNSPFPEISKDLNLNSTHTVGWVHSAAHAFVNENSNVTLAVASMGNTHEFTQLEKNNILHFIIPHRIADKFKSNSIDQLWENIVKQFQPDVVHIYGTEYPYLYSFIRVNGVKNVIVSIQGLASVYERFFWGNINKSELRRSITIRDLLRINSSIFAFKKRMHKFGKMEQSLIKEVKHFEGRTSWDKAHVWALNPDGKYYSCPRTMRPSFYTDQWSFDKCKKHSIFISQAHNPIKGFHQIIKALPIVLRHFPDTMVYVAGNNFFTNRGFRISTFGNYINKLIKKDKLNNHVVFTGVLSEKEMFQRFVSSHVFVCPSAIENSPNAIGEAQLLGVPCIASYVGGNADMIEHEKTGLLYRYEETEMLALNICKIFSNSSYAERLSINSRACALKRHNPNYVGKRLNEIYTQILNNQEEPSTEIEQKIQKIGIPIIEN